MPSIIDLTLTLIDGMRGVGFEQAKTVHEDGWNARNLHLYSHTGTHMDAQTHFAAGPGTIDKTPLDRCMGPAWVVRLPKVLPKQRHSVLDLGVVADRFRPGDSLLLESGWSRHVNDPAVYRDQLPRVSDELAQWCVDHHVNILGVEPPSVADVNNLEEVTRIHKILLGAKITIVEGLTNLDALKGQKVFFIAAPLKIDGGDGCPCRAFAFESEPGSAEIILRF
jgi:arylformamidase